jgi:hypothetical protein
MTTQNGASIKASTTFKQEQEEERRVFAEQKQKPKRRRIVEFERKRPPCAHPAKDGAASSSKEWRRYSETAELLFDYAIFQEIF